MEKVFKEFKIVEKEGIKGKYYMIAVENFLGKVAEMFLTECQKELIDIEGIENCSVSVVERKSKENKPYKAIALFVGGEVFDFFPRDRAFITLSEVIARRKTEKNK